MTLIEKGRWHPASAFLIALLLQAAPPASHAQSCLAPGGAPGATQRLAAPAQWSAPASAGLFGANALYHVDDDAFWAADGAVQALREMNISSLRYPGGELAENFDWETNRVERPKEFPFERSESDASARTDWRELLAHASALGAQDLYFVVNIESAFRAGGDIDANLRTYADKAARWVKAVKAGGGRVRYWEIGNEPFLAGGFPLTPEEYVRALRVFAKAMRAADSTALIGATGPHVLGGRGFAGSIGPQALAELREGEGKRKACRGMTREECVKHLRKSGGKGERGPVWWQYVAKEGRGSYDFVTTHRYVLAEARPGGEHGKFALSAGIAQLQALLQEANGKRIPIAITEWNTPNEKRNEPLDPSTQMLQVAMHLGSMAATGITHAHYWPLRWEKGSSRVLLEDEARITPSGRVFALLGRTLPGAQVAETMPSPALYALLFKSAKGDGAVLANSGRSSLRAEWEAKAGAAVEVERVLAQGGDPAAARCSDKVGANGRVRVDVPAGALAVVRIAR